MEHFTEFPDHKKSDCDVTIERPVIISQTDAGMNIVISSRMSSGYTVYIKKCLENELASFQLKVTLIKGHFCCSFGQRAFW